MDPRSGITACLTVDNWNSWSNQFSAHLMAKGLYQYIASEDSLVIPSKYACIAKAAKDKLTTSQKSESDVLREKDRVKLLTFIDSEDQYSSDSKLHPNHYRSAPPYQRGAARRSHRCEKRGRCCAPHKAWHPASVILISRLHIPFLGCFDSVNIHICW